MQQQSQNTVKYQAKAQYLDESNAKITLQVQNLNQDNIIENYLIVAVDTSGSMGGNPIVQVRNALQEIVKLNNSSQQKNETVLLKYESNCKVIKEDEIEKLYAGGGTSFTNAFQEIKRQISIKQQDIKENSSPQCMYQIIFLTDGQDNSGFQVQDMQRQFRNEFGSFQYTFHAIGFGSYCDRNLLNQIRNSSSGEPGYFRYAEPTDDHDALCSKIIGLFQNVSPRVYEIDMGVFQNENEQVENEKSIKKIQIQVDINNSGKYEEWIKIPIKNDFSVKIQRDGKFTDVRVEREDFIQKEKQGSKEFQELQQDFIQKQFDEIAKELIDFQNKKKELKPQAIQFYYLLVKNRIQDLTIKSSDKERGVQLQQQVEGLINGQQLNEGKLLDLQFGSKFANENQFKGKNQNQQQKQIKQDDDWVKQYRQNQKQEQQEQKKQLKFEKETTPFYSMNNEGKQRNPLQELIFDKQTKKNGKICDKEVNEFVQQCQVEQFTHTDQDGNNALMVAGYCGQKETVESILKRMDQLEILKENINKKNNFNESAVTLSIKKRGYWLSSKILFDNGATIQKNRVKHIKQYLIDNMYQNTHKMMEEQNYLDEEELNFNVTQDMSPEYLTHLFQKWIKIQEKNLKEQQPQIQEQQQNQEESEITQQKNIQEYNSQELKLFLQVFIKKKMYEQVRKAIENYKNKLDFENLIELLQVDNDDTDLLFEQAWNLSDKKNLTNFNNETLLFKAAERGSLKSLELICQTHMDDIDKQNSLGNSALWVACAKKYPCIIQYLVNQGADINLQNLKGDPPIFQICQKGPIKIAEYLIQCGADPSISNKNGDNCILICSRNGQHQIQELLLQYSDEEVINKIADIDGFNALHSCVEQNNFQCIKGLKEYIDIETKISLLSPVKDLVGGTALHIAGYYAGLENSAEELLEQGANINAIDQQGMTALHLAVIQKNYNMIKLLLQKGADIELQDKHKNIAQKYANGDKEILKYFYNPIKETLIQLSKGMFDSKETDQILEILEQDYSKQLNQKNYNLLNFVHNDEVPLINTVVYNKYQIFDAFLRLNADLQFKNKQGISSVFWIEWIKNKKFQQKISQDLVDEDTRNQIERVTLQSKASIQNRMILNMQGVKKDYQQQQKDVISEKMNNSFSEKLYQEYDQNQENQQQQNQQIQNLNVMDVLYNSGKDMQKIIFDLKLSVISQIAAGNNDLGAQELAALYLYTSTDFWVAKEKLNLKQKDLYIFRQIMREGIQKLPGFEGELYIGNTQCINRGKFLIGNKLVINDFMSACAQWKQPYTQIKENKNIGTMFLIKSKNGKLISKYSQFENQEAVFTPGTVFEVSNWYYGKDIQICLGQENIRATTYKIKDEDIEKHIKGIEALVIELTEV